MIGGEKNTSEVIDEVLKYQGAPMPKPTDPENADVKVLLQKRRYSCASTFLMLLRRFQLSPSDGGARSGFILGKLADFFGLQVRGRYRNVDNATRKLSKAGLSMDGLSEVLALFLTFPWYPPPQIYVCVRVSKNFNFTTVHSLGFAIRHI